MSPGKIWRDSVPDLKSGSLIRGFRIRISQPNATKKIMANVNVPANEQSPDCIFMLPGRAVLFEEVSMAMCI